jgi:hypothetical protein
MSLSAFAENGQHNLGKSHLVSLQDGRPHADERRLRRSTLSGPYVRQPSVLGLMRSPSLAGLLLQIGGALIEERLFDNSRIMQRFEYLQLTLIFSMVRSSASIRRLGSSSQNGGVLPIKTSRMSHRAIAGPRRRRRDGS